MISAKPVMMVPSRREATGLIAIFPACGPSVPSPAVPEAVWGDRDVGRGEEAYFGRNKCRTHLSNGIVRLRAQHASYGVK